MEIKPEELPKGTHLANLCALPYLPTDPETRIITVRLPKSLHGLLIDSAARERTSLNLLCTARLIAEIPLCPIVSCGSADLRLQYAAWRLARHIVRRCRQCGCTQNDIQRSGDRGSPCYWIEWDLCSACVPVTQPVFKG